MASGGPLLNGELPRPPGQAGTLEETLQQMTVLIQENHDLKEALRQTNLTMKERLEGLSAWREKQRQERELLETRLQEARAQVESLDLQNQDLSRRLEEGGAGEQRAQLGALRLQVSRLQAEKSDLLALNSELQLRAEQDHSFIQVIQVSDSGGEGLSEVCGPEGGGGELTVSQLLQSLRNETQQRERLQDRIRELEDRRAGLDQATQTAESQEEGGGEEKASEVQDLKGQMRTLFQELQQAQRRLDEAEAMKKNLQDRVRDLEQDLNALRAGQAENERLKLQLDSQQAQSLVEQRRAEDERNNLAQLKDAYTKLFEDYSELKEDGRKREAEGGGLQQRLAAAEEALASKQTRIDELKQEMVQKEKELETISVFQAQAEVYSSDFYAERAAREKLHEEKERLAARLDYVQKQNSQLQEELDSLGRSSLTHMQKRHLAAGGGPLGPGAALVGRGPDWQRRGDLPEHVCPKCSETLPDLDSLQIHIMDCIN